MILDVSDPIRSPALQWHGASLVLLDQRCLPTKAVSVPCVTASQVADAIKTMIVRGAPAIGVAAAYGVALSVRQHADLPAEIRRRAINEDIAKLKAARPTAVNLTWALEKMRPLVESGAHVREVAAYAESLHRKDIVTNEEMAKRGSSLISTGSRVLTHCNTGPLACGGVGTALGVIVSAWQARRIAQIWFTETRPWLQGARLTSWELSQAAIPATLVTDLCAGNLLLNGKVDWFIVGADRVAANGDVINKIGTAPLAALARQSGAKVMVVAPSTTLDLSLESGESVAIEVRDASEIWSAAGVSEAPQGIEVYNPVFDVTPAESVDVLITEVGVYRPVEGEVPKSEL